MSTRKDLIILVADLDMEQTLQGLLTRPSSLGIRQISYDVLRHPQRDPGCCSDCHNVLRSQSNLYDYALVMFDHHGSGKESESVDKLQDDIEAKLIANGWSDDRACVVVIKPELENWVWSNSPHVDEILGWKGRSPDLRTWLKTEKFLVKDSVKPDKPKEAMQAALRKVNKRHSAAIFKQLASRVSTKGCVSDSFDRFKSKLQTWFP